MLDHHLQRSIVYALAFADSLRFSELKPDMVENKLFDYHLKKVIVAGFVAKTKDGHYALTPEGRRIGVQVFAKQQTWIDHAYSVLLLLVKRKDGAWLLATRKGHPLIDRVGFMHAAPNADEDCLQTAQKTCKEKTGLDADFAVKGGGYFRIYDKDNLESFTHFTLLACEDAQGELVQNDQQARYEWQDKPDFSDPRMLPNMATLAELYARDELFFIEETFHS